MTAPIVRVVLDEAAFRKLVSGGVVETADISNVVRPVAVQIILSDIGFDRMFAALDEARRGGRGDGAT